MKGNCCHCNDKYFVRLDRHIARIHKMSKLDEGVQGDKTQFENGQLSDAWPWQFLVPEKYLKGSKRAIPFKERFRVNSDSFSHALACYLQKNNVEWLIKHNSNPLTFMSLARMLHLIHYLHIVQPTDHPCAEDMLAKWKENPKNWKKLKAQYHKFFKKMNEVILGGFKPLFLKYPRVVRELVSKYSHMYK